MIGPVNSPSSLQVPSSALFAARLAAAQDALRTGRGDLAVGILEPLVALDPAAAAAWQLLGFAYGDEQRIADAARAFARAAALAPQDGLTAFAHAQASLDAGLPAVTLFARAQQLAPADLRTIHGRAAALSAQGDEDAADDLLTETLRQHPDWLQGHRSLATLRWAAGDAQQFTRSYAAACAAGAGSLPLRLAWFSTLMQAHEWEAARRVLTDGAARLGAQPAFLAARAILAAESGDLRGAATYFAQAASLRDDALDIAHIRYCLRTGELARAEELALRLVGGRSATLAWPYLSAIWRLRGDGRALWLDGAPPSIRAFDLDFPEGELVRLATVLRQLQTARTPYTDQSVRGGTQTDVDRQLLFRAEPEIQAARDRICGAVREYIAGLPPAVAGHPLLGQPRGRFLFSGSWSVRLTRSGHHVSHTHPKGWISSALYISLPSPTVLGAAPAGWIRFGVPPASLGLGLAPCRQVEPRPGRLVLFPSTMWHDTLPFDDGERLVIAFDVIPRSVTTG
jgi:Flp pilus assembly protein TadD